MQSLNVWEFREQLLTLIDRLPPEGVLVTKRGKPVAQLLPVRKPGGSLVGALKGRFEIGGDSSPREKPGMLNVDTHVLP